MEPAPPEGGINNYNTNILNNNHHCNSCNIRIFYKIIFIDHANNNNNNLEAIIFHNIKNFLFFLTSNNITMLSKPPES